MEIQSTASLAAAAAAKENLISTIKTVSEDFVEILEIEAEKKIIS